MEQQSHCQPRAQREARGIKDSSLLCCLRSLLPPLSKPTGRREARSKTGGQPPEARRKVVNSGKRIWKAGRTTQSGKHTLVSLLASRIGCVCFLEVLHYGKSDMLLNRQPNRRMIEEWFMLHVAKTICFLGTFLGQIKKSSSNSK